MPQISFTKNNEQVCARFSRLLLEEQLKRGKLTAPQMLDLLLDHWDRVQVQGNTITIATTAQLEAHNKRFIHQYPGGNFDASKALEYIFNKPETETE